MSVSFKDEVDLFGPPGWEDFTFDAALPDQTDVPDDSFVPWPLDSRSASVPQAQLSWQLDGLVTDHYQSLSAVSSSTGPPGDTTSNDEAISRALSAPLAIGASASQSLGPVEPPRQQPASLALARSNSAPGLKTRRPHKRFKKYSAQNPSRYCHICAKKRDEEPSIICHNVSNLLCQKRVCRKCFTKRNWDWDAAVAPGSNWLCPHCRGECPKEGRCFVYGRGNRRQELSRPEMEPPSHLGMVQEEIVTPERPNYPRAPSSSNFSPFNLPSSSGHNAPHHHNSLVPFPNNPAEIEYSRPFSYLPQ